MSTSPNWGPEHSPADPSSVELPSMANSSDLFHGELFGDELLDIYNAAVEVNANSDSHQDNGMFRRSIFCDIVFSFVIKKRVYAHRQTLFFFERNPNFAW